MMGHNALLDGFTVTEGDLYGIYGEGVDFIIENCVINDNESYGVFAKDGNMTVKWCKVKNNGLDGIYHAGEGNLIIVENCKIIENKANGIFAEDSTPTIKNSVLPGNGFTDEGFFGIYILLPAEVPVLYNNTIAYNANVGLLWVDDFGGGVDPNVLDYPDIQNCILWYNNDGGEQLAGYTFTQYSCVFDPNNPEGTTTPDANGNITCPPGFAYEYSTDPNVLLNVHLAYDSPCIDMGNPNHDANNVGSYDMDAEDRIVDSRVDIGADEVYSCDDDLTEDDIYNEVDWTADGIVNFHEYGIFASAWLSVDANNPLCDPNNPDYVSDPNEPGYITEGDKLRYSRRCDLDDDMDVDMADFALFCDEWLWMACWKQSQMDSSIMLIAMGMGGGESAMMPVPLPATLSTDSTVIAGAEPKFAFPSESDLARFVNGVNEIIGFVDRAIKEDHPNSEALYEMKAYLEAILMELRETISVK